MKTLAASVLVLSKPLSSPFPVPCHTRVVLEVTTKSTHPALLLAQWPSSKKTPSAQATLKI